jgi:hypothetical protein
VKTGRRGDAWGDPSGWPAASSMMWRRGAGAADGGRIRLLRSVPMSHAIRCGRCRWLGHPFAWSRPSPGGMGRIRVRGSGQTGPIKSAPAPRRRTAGGLSNLVPHRSPAKAVHAAVLGYGSPAADGGVGQAADLAVPQAVRHQCEELAGGRTGGPGDVASLLATSGDDGFQAEPITESRRTRWMAR